MEYANFGETSIIDHVTENLAMVNRMVSILIRINPEGVKGTAERRRPVAWMLLGP